MEIDVTKYLSAYDKVFAVMESVNETVEEYMRESLEDGTIDPENYDNIHSLAMEYARTYALRDVMTLMVYGLPVEEALTVWKEEKGLKTIDLDGECLNAVTEAIEEIQGYEDDEEEVE